MTLATVSETGHSPRHISLQWLRCTAALMVLLYHASAYLQLIKQSDYFEKILPSWFGGVGVSLFFALSGNLMGSAMLRTSASRFLLHRVVRIYPLFFLVTALFATSSMLSHLKVSLGLQALTLFPYGKSSYPLGVEWTLVFEIAFYMFVFLLIFFNKAAHAGSFLLGWLALILMNNVLHPEKPAVSVFHPFTLPWVSFNVSFAMGMLFPLILKRHSPHPVLAFLIGFTLFNIGLAHSVVGARWAMGIGSALFVLSLTQFEGPTWLRSWSQLNWLGEKLGSYSYALYLCHVPVIRTLYTTMTDSTVNTLFFSAVVLSLLISIPIGEVDIRMYRTLKSRIDLSPSATASVLTGLYTFAFLGFTVFSIYMHP